MVPGVELETKAIGCEVSNQPSKKLDGPFTTNLDRQIGSKLVEEVVQLYFEYLQG